MTLAGQGIVVTGGSSGFGLAVARRAVSLGARVASLDVADRDGTADGRDIVHVPCDVTDAARVAEAFADAAAALGRIDGVFANAGIIGTMAPIEELRPDEWRRTLAVGLDGVFHTVHAAVPHLRDRGGSIVVTASITGTRSFATEGAVAYAAAKAGAVAVARVAAVELGRFGIRVNSVSPGGVRTRIVESATVRGVEELAHERRADAPLTGPQTSADDVAELVCFLFSPAGARISGADIPIDGAQSLLGGGILRAGAAGRSGPTLEQLVEREGSEGS